MRRRQPSVNQEQGHGFPMGGVFRAALDAVVIIDAHGLIRDWNPAAERLLGYMREETAGRELAALIIPGPLRDAHRNALARYLETGESTILDRRVELSALHKDGSEIAVELAVTRVPDTEPVLFAGFVRPTSERQRTERENARLHHRMAFLAQAWIALDGSLDYRETLERLAALVVPELAELAVVDLADEEGLLRTAVAAAEDPAQARALEAMRRAHPLRATSAHPVAQVLRTRQALLLPEMTGGFLREIAEGREHLELMQQLRYHSAIVVPLIARRSAIGTLSLLRMHGAPVYDRDDLVLAEELARRAALTVDNARLLGSSRRLARTLQDSLLPRALPDVPGVRLTARYRAAHEGQDVGGDFYDAFALGESCWGVAIGDVCGKGPEAAALTSLARYTIRALAHADPAVVLQRLNAAVVRDRDLIHDRFLTALFAVLTRSSPYPTTGAPPSPTFAGGPAPPELEINLASAGHPAPLVRRRDGTVETIDASGPLIGVMADVEYRAVRLALSPGDCLVLYTDGLTDARAPSQVLTESDLAGLLARSRGMSGQRLTEFMEQAVTAGEEPRDDIAMLLIEPLGVPAAVGAARLTRPAGRRA
jgi:PAS domain S-box-containing protein